ncbi:MAG TPA: di-heme oxidoredictase family protein, partial [Thermoanaerobaculia bacterium]|nr:di-heme oxidoredictase family protein [Thermoanaerobaculia bacterium]
TFFMSGAPAKLTAAQTCASCHVPSMPLYSAQLFIDDPGPAKMEPSDCQAHPFRNSLISPNSAPQAPYLSRLGATMQTRAAAASLSAGLPCPREGTKGFCIDLTNVPPGVPEHVLPRLPRTGGVIQVPLFSDLRTHDMGPNLADVDLIGNPENQPTDVAGLCITSRIFLTRPLWGVRDTGPWLHDGRALTLSDAILMHGGEAQPAADAFHGLSAAQQQDVVNFLLSLYLPCMSSIDCPPPPPPASMAAVSSDSGS